MGRGNGAGGQTMTFVDQDLALGALIGWRH